jgi:hypothetical protein
MKKGLAVFSGSAVVHKLMQDGRVELGTAANPAAVTVSGNINVTGQLTASADNIEVSNVRSNFTASTLGGILVELKNAATSGTSALSSSLKTYIDAQDSAEAAARVAGDAAVQSNLNTVSGSLSGALTSEIAARIAGDSAVQSNLNSVSSSLAGIIQGNFEIQQTDSELLRSDIEATQANLDSVSGSLSGALSAETAARIAGDADLQSQIDALETASAGDTSALSSSLKAYIDGLDAAQTSANSSLSSSFDGRVGSLESTVTTLIGDTGSISAALTTIQNLAEYLDGDGNPATLVADLSTEVNRISGALVQEAIDRVSGDAAVQTNLDSVSGSLSGALAQEKLDRASADTALQANLDSVSGSLSGAVASEASARIAADQVLSSSIDALDVRLDALEAYNGNVVHVDPVGGVDAVGNGTLLKPFRTINYAYSQVQSLGNAANSTYNANVEKFVTEKLIFKLAPGTYAEDVVLGFKRARVALVGNGVRIAGTVKMDVKKADFPASNLEAFKAQYPAPWTGFSAQMSFEIAGDAGGGLESDPTANVVTVTGRTSLEFENGGANYNWDSNFGQFYVSVDNAAILGGVVMIHDNTVTSARAPAVVLEVESSRIGNADSGSRTYCGFVPFGASTTVPSFGSLTLKAHNSTFASVIGPTMTIGEIDGCRVYDIDRTMSGSVTNGSIGGSTSTSYLGIVNTQFRNLGGSQGSSLYRIGPTTGTVRYKIDSVSHTTLAFSRASNGILSVRTLDTGSGVVFDFLDNAGSQFVSHVPTNYTMSGSVTSSLGHFAGIDAALGAQTTARNSLSSSLKTYIDAQDTSVSSSLKNYIDNISTNLSGGQAADTSALWAAITASNSAISDEVTRATAAESLISGNLAAEISRATTAEAGLQSAIDTEKGRIDAILSGSSVDLDTFKEVVDFVNSIDLTNDNALLAAVTNINSDISSISGSLVSEVSRALAAEGTISGNLAAEVARATAAEAGLQSQIDGAQITINGIALDPFASGALSIVTGSANLVVSTSGGNVVVDLASTVNVGSLTATGSVTSTGGDLVASHGAMKATLDSSVDSARLAQLSDSGSLASGSFDGMSFYLKGAATGAFSRADCWYFCQGGVWFDAPFFAGE